MNIEDDLVYIHVDNNDTRGDGTLFTSDSDGRVFSQSLRNHFYPSIEITSDFYKVKSMRGTYIVSQLNADRSIRSLITFNRGAEWKQIKKPENEPCHNKEKSECYLQITGKLSLRNNIKSSLPLSSESALGIVLVHGHLASSLKTSRSDVYISSDGGYNWIKALNGPHEYVIADHGGLLVALGENKKFIKFSTDEGRCWHEHQFTTDDIHITGLLTEPGNKAMTVLIWGYNVSNSEWVIHVVDLSQLLDRECSSADYEEWYAHSEMTHSLGNILWMRNI
jgi:sortilin